MRAFGVLAGRARRRADRAADRDVRDASDGQRAGATEAVLLRRGLAAARGPGRARAAGSLQRMGRSELAVPIISTQLVTDALVGERESLENLLGATFVFGMRSEAEAARALTLLGPRPRGPRACASALLELEAGRCLFRDHRGRVEAVQVDVVVPVAAARVLDDPGVRVTAGSIGRCALLARGRGPVLSRSQPRARTPTRRAAHSSRGRPMCAARRGSPRHGGRAGPRLHRR